MWQSRVENVHYSASMKIELKADMNASGHCLYDSRLLAPSRVRATSYRPRNTAHFRIANHCNYCYVSKKLAGKIETRSSWCAWRVIC